LASGTYGGRIISTAASSTNRINIIKATAASHITDTGWIPGMADQAVFNLPYNARVEINTSYVTLDGMTGEGADAGINGSGSDQSTYGFKFQNDNCALITDNDTLLAAPWWGFDTTDFHSIKISHAAFVSCGSSYLHYQVPIYSNPKSGDFELSHCYLVGGTSNLLTRNWSAGSEIQHNYFGYNWYDSIRQSCQQMSNGGDDDIDMSNNIYLNSGEYINGVHGGSDGRGGTYNAYRWKIYNNIFYGGQCTVGNADSVNPDTVINWEVHHNTFINCTPIGANGPFFVGTLTDAATQKSYAYNNLFYNIGNPRLDNYAYTAGAIIHDYNAYINVTGTKTTETNWYVASGDPFVNLAGGNYHLATALSGTTLASPFNADYNGLHRILFSQGAYEYVSSDTTPPAAPSGLSVS
jgi:hypothetical protein